MSLPNDCRDIFKIGKSSTFNISNQPYGLITENELAEYVSQKIELVPEFQYISKRSFLSKTRVLCKRR
jgi:hypothetical protein